MIHMIMNHMVKLVKVLRCEWESFQFTGSFLLNCQSNLIPTTLKLFLSNGKAILGSMCTLVLVSKSRKAVKLKWYLASIAI